MLVEDLSAFFLSAILFTIGGLVSAAVKKGGHAKEHHPVDLRRFKTCPGCADQLPLSTLVCDACEHNFLSGPIGSKHKLLPAPDAVRVSA